MLCFLLALCAVVAEDTPGDEPIPFSEGRGQIFASSDELIQSFLHQMPKASELPAVIPAGSHIPDRISATKLETLFDTNNTGSTYPIGRSRELTDHGQETRAPVAPESVSSENLGQFIGDLPHILQGQGTPQIFVNLETAPPRPEFGQFVQLPDHVRQVLLEQDTSQESDNPEPDRPKFGQAVQLPKHVKQVLPEQDTPQECDNPEPDQPKFGQAVQLPDHVKQVLPEQETPHESDNPEPDRPKFGQAVQLPDHVKQVIPVQYTQQAAVNTEPERPNFGQSVQIPDHVKQVLPEQDTQQKSVNFEPVLPRPNFGRSVPQPFDHVLPPLEDRPQKSVILELPNLEEHTALEFSESPPRPNFNRSLHLRDDLTVPRSGYTEVYDIEWHAESNTARTAIGNSTTIYRKTLPTGHIQYLEVKSDRTNSSEVRRCTMSPPLLPASSIDRAFPGLPDLEPFHFVGYTNTTEEGRSRGEHWQYFVVGRPGEGGAARGESLNTTHDFFVFRDGGDAVPIRYTVVTDSSVLGPVSDTYTHRYHALPAPMAAILPDTTQECDVMEALK